MADDKVKKTKSNPADRFGGPGPGRPKGVPNKSTIEFRQTISELLEKNASNVQKWLDQVAEGSAADNRPPAPEKALDLLGKLAEYAAPKLARTELVGDGGGAVKFEVLAPWLKPAITERN